MNTAIEQMTDQAFERTRIHRAVSVVRRRNRGDDTFETIGEVHVGLSGSGKKEIWQESDRTGEKNHDSQHHQQRY